MSDINHNRMIPLHVCDQAVAACNAEIQKLREENARLQGLAMIREGRLAVPYDYEQLREEIATLQAEVQRLRHRSEALREAGDELWFCLRHGKRLTHAEVQEAVEDWQSARDGR